MLASRHAALQPYQIGSQLTLPSVEEPNSQEVIPRQVDSQTQLVRRKYTRK
jgi:hypothetical protein